jgi:hypothetical protein
MPSIWKAGSASLQNSFRVPFAGKPVNEGATVFVIGFARGSAGLRKH